MNSSLKTWLVLLITILPLNAQTLPEAFQRLLVQTKMQFSIPPNFTATPIIDNGDVVYDFAVKSITTDLEIRYRIWPVDKTPKNPNSIFEAMLITMGLNISNGKIIEPSRYPPESVKQEFGADAGCSGLVPVDSEFGKGYRSCMISVIHKDNVADAYVFYLYNDRGAIMQALTTDKVYHALRFK